MRRFIASTWEIGLVKMNDENVSPGTGNFTGQIHNTVVVVEDNQRRGVFVDVFGRGRSETALVAGFEFDFFGIRRIGIERLDAFAVFLYARRVRIDIVQRPFLQRQRDNRFDTNPRMVFTAFQYHFSHLFVYIEYGHFSHRVYSRLSAQGCMMASVQYRFTGIHFFVHLDLDHGLRLNRRRRHVVDQYYVRSRIDDR